MHKRIILIVALVLVASVAVSGALAAPAKEKRHIVGLKFDKPKKNKKIEKRFVPPAMVSGSEKLKWIEREESEKWGASYAVLDSRIGIESTWQPDVGCNESGHCGIGQFAASTFSRGLSTMPRKVVVRKVTHPKKWIWKTTRWSDQTVSHKRYRKMTVNRYVRKVGYIPESPPIDHVWAQVRIMAQAIVGKSAVSESEWTCCE